MNIAQVYLSGNVTRYHTHPTMPRQNLADHHGRCVQLLLALHNDPSVALIRAVALHDVGEYIVGDLPYMFKRNHPKIADKHRKAEIKASVEIIGFDLLNGLSDDDLKWIKFVDSLESLLFMYANNEKLSMNPDWIEQEDLVLNAAHDLGCFDYANHAIRKITE